MKPEAAVAFSLLSAQEVRERAQRMLILGLDDKLPYFRIELERLDNTVDLVVDTTRRNYPSLAVPFHSRWRHFVFNSEDRWAAIDKAANWRDAAARTRAAFDLAIVSVLLDASAGPQWQYCDPVTGRSVGRSEGLALASLDMFRRGVFSSHPSDPLQADTEGLMRLSEAIVGDGLQVSSSNSLPGMSGRVDLLRRLGTLIAAKPDVFSREDIPRPGGVFDHLAAMSDEHEIAAATVLSELLHQFGPVWPSRLTLDGVPLGDCWRHPAIVTPDASSGLVPLHKLSQWLAYSLIEPMQWAGISVSDIDGLTGLAEYRNGGLLIDTGVLVLRDTADAARNHDVASPLVVEWRALTVALLDRLAESMRSRLKIDRKSMSLAQVLEGGTWSAGRLIANKLRSDGSPPVKVVSDGTVF
ncbi:MAG TPA: URC4/urg3 family protein [Steroidobacteraceae bacterium]